MLWALDIFSTGQGMGSGLAAKDFGRTIDGWPPPLQSRVPGTGADQDPPNPHHFRCPMPSARPSVLSRGQGLAAANGALAPSGPGLVQEAWDYWLDAGQRSLLFLHVLQQRSEGYREHQTKVAPHVLKFTCELVMDGRRLPRPVNYVLVRIVPPEGTNIDIKKRPFVVVDPRAGHGPGIGGFKAQSEVGVALKAGHPCFFIGFLPEPMLGQTIEDIAHAEAAFLERVIELHPHAEGKPAVIGNCQAGWAVMLLAAQRPDLFGPIIVAGSPLSYWAGVRGQYPMRYTGGLLGGTWLTALMGDLGNGKFDGAWLVSNFENLNPANTLWAKHHNLYAKIDTEEPRYLEFEQWWGGHVLLNAHEMQFIADELFVGNKLASSEIAASDGSRIDLRNVGSPIVVFCSKADNITPPQQALGWILDLYESVDDIQAHGQTIVYAIHESIGHLGIFVSGSVAKKEHDEFASNIDLIDVLPPGLYEAVMRPKDHSDPSADLIGGDYLVHFESRTLADIRALGGNDEEDERKFEAAARVSEINLGLYRTFMQPWVRTWANEGFAQWMRRLHPLRLQFELLSPVNPFVRPLLGSVADVRKSRQPVSEDNQFWRAQEQLSDWIEASLDAYRDARDQAYEAWFDAIYGSPLVQAMVGLKASDVSRRHRPRTDGAHRALVARRIEELKAGITKGGPREAVLRALLYIRMPEGAVDERGFNLLRRMREETGKGLTLAAFKKLVREQYFMLQLDERRAVEAIPSMLARDPELASRMASTARRLIEVVGLSNKESKARLAEMKALFEGKVVREAAARAHVSAIRRSRPARPEVKHR
jgi:pimeloyl-ACP methyl ester carboxylesterase